MSTPAVGTKVRNASPSATGFVLYSDRYGFGGRSSTIERARREVASSVGGWVIVDRSTGLVVA